MSYDKYQPGILISEEVHGVKKLAAFLEVSQDQTFEDSLTQLVALFDGVELPPKDEAGVYCIIKMDNPSLFYADFVRQPDTIAGKIMWKPGEQAKQSKPNHWDKKLKELLYAKQDKATSQADGGL